MFLIMVAGIACALILSCKKKTDRWVNYSASSDSGQRYYDSQKMETVSPNIIRVWDKLKIQKEEINDIISKRKAANLPVEGWNNVESIAILREIDCTNNTNKMIRIENYNDEGKTFSASDYQNPKAEPIHSGSTVDTLRNAVCPK
jgi:hypothetical protein